jgi:integrase
VNPLAGVSRKKNKGKKKMPKRVPLSEEEISKLLNAIRDNTFCPNASKFKHSHYHPFLCFMFLTGARNAEAIGLRVKHVDFKANRIEISETFARTAAWWM